MQVRPGTCSAVRLAHLPDTEGVPSSNLGRCTHTQDGRPNGSAVLCVLARGPAGDDSPLAKISQYFVRMPTTNAGGTSVPDYAAGFADQPTEIEIDSLETVGTIPAWLDGDLLRNGPAMWRVGGHRLNHWFDGMAMLHRFGIRAGKVSYTNRFLRSKDYQAAQNGAIEFSEFATDLSMPTENVATFAE